MQRFIMAVLLVAIAMMVAMDCWLATLRCASSPSIDWSRLGFALVMQLAVVVGSLVLVRGQGSLGGPTSLKLSVGLLAAAAVTFVLVRQPLLLGDTTLDKFHASGSVTCPGVPDAWKHGR